MEIGPKAVLIKGGHAVQTATDVLYNGYEFIVYEEKKIATKNTHGTGCTLSSAIAALLAQNYSLEEAVQQAKSYLTGAIKAAALHSPGHGYGPVSHFWFYKNPWRK